MECPNSARNSAQNTQNKKLKQSSLHKKRKKRKLEGAEMHPDQPKLARRAGLPTGSSRSGRPSRLLGPLLVAIIVIEQLLCDMAGVSSPTTTTTTTASVFLPSLLGALADPQEPSQIRFQFDNVEQAAAASGEQPTPRFLGEPRDAFALEGQREVTLSCVILAPDRGLQPYWTLGTRMIALDTKSLGHRQASATLRRQALADWAPVLTLASHNSTTHSQAQSDNNNNNNNNNQNSLTATTTTMIVYNYTLHMANVSLANEGQYQCGALGLGRNIQSARAWLRVLRPPAPLEVTVRSRTVAAAAAAAEEEDEESSVVVAALVGATATAQQDPAQNPSPQVVEVRRDAQVRLECRSSGARPRAELAWLDAETGRQVAPRLAGDSLSATAEDYSSEELISAGAGATSDQQDSQAGETNTLVWSFKASAAVHGREFVCRARHKALELMPMIAVDHIQSRRLQLSVVFAPEPQIVRQPLHPREHEPLELECLARARPPAHAYTWLVDGHPIEGAHEAKLRIANLTRQLHMREIRCQANNSVGLGTASAWLAVKYAPAYVTHLLPASLQPDYYHSAPGGASQPSVRPAARVHHATSGAHRKHKVHAHHKQRHEHQHQLAVEPRLARELAYVAAPGEDVTLRCDFDANPAPARIQWLHISTDYDNLEQVLPHEADELLKFGANHARFRPAVPPILPAGGVAGPTSASALLPAGDFVSLPATSYSGGGGSDLSSANSQQQQEEELRHNKRHIYKQQQQEEEEDQMATEERRRELDFARMSRELLDELQVIARSSSGNAKISLRASDKTPQPKHSSSIVTLLNDTHTSATQVDIGEPLALQVRPADWRHHHHLLSLRHQHHLGGRGHKAPAAEMYALANSTTATTNNNNNNSELVLAETEEQLERAAYSTSSGDDDDDSTSSHSRRVAAATLVAKPRRAQVTSSSLHVGKYGPDLVGRYVCQAVSGAEGGASQVVKDQIKSIFVVARQGPRLVSAKQQTSPLGATQPLQIECLAQVNAAQAHNQTTRFQWFRDNQLLHAPEDEPHEPAPTTPATGQQRTPPKSFSVQVQVSPDGLFMRSRLLVHNAEINDFGRYNCTVENALGRDSMELELLPQAATGISFNLIQVATMLIAAVFILAVCMLVCLGAPPCPSGLWAPSKQQRLDAKAKKLSSSQHHQHQHAVAGLKNSSTALLRAGSKGGVVVVGGGGGAGVGQQTSNSCSASYTSDDGARSTGGCSSSGRSSLRKVAAGEPISHQNLGDELDSSAGFVSAALSASGQVLGRRPESALSAACGGVRDFSGTSRASLRSPSHWHNNENNNNNNNSHQYQMPRQFPGHDKAHQQQQQHASDSPTKSRFAAIHESLESKLQFGGGGGASSGNAHLQSATSCDNQNFCASASPSGSSRSAQDETQEAAGHSRQQRVSLIGRLKLRFNSGGGGGGGGANQRGQPARRSLSSSAGKRRPTISTPLEAGGGQLKRASALSNSLTHVVDRAASLHRPPHAGTQHHLMMAHLSGGGGPESRLLAASSAQLQDSSESSAGGCATATTSSGRSSSTSNHQMSAHQQHQQQQHEQLHSSLPPPPPPAPHMQLGAMNLLYHPHPQQEYLTTMQQQWQPPATMTCDSNNLYANSAGSPYDNYQAAQQQQQVLYANECGNPYGVLGGQAQQVAAAAADQYQQSQQQQQQLASSGQHYQLPLMMGESSYLAPRGGPEETANEHTRTCYSTICGQLADLSSHHQKQQQQLHQLSLAAHAKTYGPPPGGAAMSLQQQQQQQLMATGQVPPQPPIMVPTSDGADAYFESNYGTLLSQSSAYKTLAGYYQQPAAPPGHPQQVANSSAAAASGSSASSSPANSLTTHASALPLALNISGTRLQTLVSSAVAGNLSTSHHLQQQQQSLHNFHNEPPSAGKLDELAEEREEEEERDGELSLGVVAAAPAAKPDMNNDRSQQQQQQPGQPPLGPSPLTNGSSSPQQAAAATDAKRDADARQESITSQRSFGAPVEHVAHHAGQGSPAATNV